MTGIANFNGLVDAHCHVDLLPNWQQVLKDLEAKQQFTFAVTTTPRAWQVEKEVARDYRYVRIGIGLHPQVVRDRASELSALERGIPESPFVGEVGLDGSLAHKGSMVEQAKVLQRIFSVCGEVGGRTLSLHSLQATGAVLDLIERSRVHERNTLIFHWFTGSLAELRRALDLGAMISVNADMLSTLRGKSVALTAGRQRTLTETDAPFTKRHRLVEGIPDVHPALISLSRCWADDVPNVTRDVGRLAMDVWRQ
ncbi:Qat anti-phage system TatD family nuclease QatD [Stenotrophomonas sp.]|uniref:Qat anti-phage system TatD family nuclease QatD n=1 Tax=Stenotrophomonas sp. TaxID=69392 RepID=UPI00289FF92C|nr:Qat anti-phage system TatD family nuclease QatD [Stenotrophomonas sp.]